MAVLDRIPGFCPIWVIALDGADVGLPTDGSGGWKMQFIVESGRGANGVNPGPGGLWRTVDNLPAPPPGVILIWLDNGAVPQHLLTDPRWGRLLVATIASGGQVLATARAAAALLRLKRLLAASWPLDWLGVIGDRPCDRAALARWLERQSVPVTPAPRFARARRDGSPRALQSSCEPGPD